MFPEMCSDAKVTMPLTKEKNKKLLLLERNILEGHRWVGQTQVWNPRFQHRGHRLSLILANSEIQLLETSHPAITMFEHCIKAHLSNMKCSAFFLDKGDPLTARSLLLRLLPLRGRYAISAEQCNIVEELHQHHAPWASLQKQCRFEWQKSFYGGG